jgi:hypothetical protein
MFNPYDEYTWHQFKNIDSIKKMPLQEQISQYHRYLNELSIQRQLFESYQNSNQFQSFQSSAGSGAASGGIIPTASFTNILFTSGSNSSSVCYSASIFPQFGVLYYYSPSILDIGDVLYRDNNLTIPATGTGVQYYSDTVKWYKVTGSTGIVLETGSCSSLCIPVGLAYSPIFAASGTGSACTSASIYSGSSTDYYLNGSSCTSLNLNCTLYTNCSLAVAAPSGTYATTAKWYRVDNSGIIVASGSC